MVQQRRKQSRRTASAKPVRIFEGLPESAAFIGNADPAVRPLLAAATPLAAFLGKAGNLTPEERRVLVEQAIVLLEGFYVHLPLKRAMHAVDPLQRLRLLRHRLGEIESDARFHAGMTAIFTSLRDLHTNYLLPEPFAAVVASLPFRVEACVENGRRLYVVGGVATGFNHPTFKPGVELRYWNGVPIARAVEIAADRHAGSNADARLSRGLAGLTQRPLRVAPPPDEEWVVLGYRTEDGNDHDIRLDWIVTGLPEESEAIDADAPVAGAAALGIDLETHIVQRARRVLFAPRAEAARARIAAAGDPVRAVANTESTMPTVFSARPVDTPHGRVGYIRIWTFSVSDADAFVAEFVRLAELLPQNGLVIDVRDNGGGLIHAGERLLQVLTPRTIEPERVQFINTPLNLRLCELHAPSPVGIDLSAWLPSVRRSIETGAAFSAGFPITDPASCNAVGQRYYGPVVLITSARCYSTTDIFAAGFQDHRIGPVLGVDGNTGAGGANVWTHELLQALFGKPGAPNQPLPDSPLKPLPKKAGMRVAIRRTVRVGPQSGTELEDLGVVPDHRHAMTRNDLLNGNADLIARAASLLAGAPIVRLQVRASSSPGKPLSVDVETSNIDRLDFYLDGRPGRSENVGEGAAHFDLALPSGGASTLAINGFRAGELVACRRLAVP